MDKIIKNILKKLETEGFEAYVVGGFVRDKIIGRESFDVDICTNALPKEIHNIFGYNESNEYGSFNLKINKFNIDITTYREDIKYKDGKLIESKYINNLIEDIKRRDFTINTLCMNELGEIIDLLNVSGDIDKKIVKMVGDPLKRLKEDPLRILRAVRFATTLNFKIDSKLKEAIIKLKSEVSKVPLVKIRSELNKIIMSPNYKYGLKLLKDLKLDNELNFKWNKITYTDNILGMYSQFDINPKLFSKREYDTITEIRDIVKKGVIDDFVIYKYGLINSVTAGELLGMSKKDVYKINDSMYIKVDKNIEINAKEIMEILNIEPSPKLKEIKDDILDKILTRELKNSKKKIKAYIIKRYKDEV